MSGRNQSNKFQALFQATQRFYIQHSYDENIGPDGCAWSAQ